MILFPLKIQWNGGGDRAKTLQPRGLANGGSFWGANFELLLEAFGNDVRDQSIHVPP